MYKAEVRNDIYEDDFEQGELDRVADWYDTFEVSNTLLELLLTIVDHYNLNAIKDLDFDNLNEYEDSSELWFSKYMAETSNGDFEDSSDADVEAWRAGQKKLYVQRGHIIITKYIATNVDDELTKIYGETNDKI